MCLHTLQKSKVQIATQDIKVWKRLITRDDIMRSPYMDKRYHLNKLVTAKGGFNESVKDLKNGFLAYWPNDDSKYVPLDGGLHSYRHKKTAIQNKMDIYDEQVYEAIIPKGSRYIKGINDEILSDQLMIIKQVN